MGFQAAEVLRRCAAGEISFAVALVRLLIAYGDLDRVRAELACLSPSDGEADLQGTIEGIGDLLDRHPLGSALVLDALQQERGLAQPSGAGDEVERCGQLFDRLVATNPEASVALYSLGEPARLAAATVEVVDLLDRLGVLGPERRVLDIGCGIGRIAQALADKVGEITGIDIAPGMIAAARQRCAGLPNVMLLPTSGRDLALFAAGSFDLVLAVDAMPYVYRAGEALVVVHFAEVSRVLRSGGDLVILNLSYRGDLELDRQDARHMGEAVGLRVLRSGTADLRLWDGTTFHLRKPEDGVSASSTLPTRSGAGAGVMRRSVWRTG